MAPAASPPCDADFEVRYREALAAFCAEPSEVGRQEAYDLGRHASNVCGMSMLQVIDAHHRLVAEMLAPCPADYAVAYERSWQFLTELLAHYEMKLRGYREANERLVVRTDELVRAREEALAASRAKSQFLSNMSHELRTPLNSIIGFTEVMMAEGAVLTDRQKMFLTLVNSAGGHLLSLVEDLLEVGRIESGHMSVRAEDFDLNALLDEIVQSIEPAAERKGLPLRHGLDCVQRVHTDRRMLRQIVLNLLSNAVKFTSEGEVRLACRLMGDDIIIEVADTGMGIDKTMLGRLFLPFERLAAPEGVPGTGLGLYLSAQFIHRLQGTIEVQTEAGQGSCFTVRLPARYAAPPP